MLLGLGYANLPHMAEDNQSATDQMWVDIGTVTASYLGGCTLTEDPTPSRRAAFRQSVKAVWFHVFLRASKNSKRPGKQI